MPDSTNDADAKLKKLGQRVRQGLAIHRPIPEKSLKTIRDVVREQWEKDQKARSATPKLGRSKTVERQPEDPEPGR